MSFAAQMDQFMFRFLGYPYMRLTRDDSSFERTFYLLSIVRDQNRPLRLLDAGCGGAIALYTLDREAPGLISEYVGLDWRATRLYRRYQHLKTPHHFFNTDLGEDWSCGEFDIAWCSECLEHIIDDSGVFKKLCRSVKPGGYVVLSVPSEAYRRHFARLVPRLLETSPTQDGGHVRLGYTSASLGKLAEGTRAELIRVDAISKTDDTNVRRRMNWASKLAVFRNAYYTLTRSKPEFYSLQASQTDFEQFHSIAAVFRIS